VWDLWEEVLSRKYLSGKNALIKIPAKRAPFDVNSSVSAAAVTARERLIYHLESI